VRIPAEIAFGTEYDGGMFNLWLFRHGETEWSRTGQHTGRTDKELTERGKAQGARLGQRLERRPFRLVLTSPLRRARETCALAGYPDALVDEDLVEWDYGDCEGRTTEQIRAEMPGWSVWSGPVPGGETLEAVSERAERVIARARTEPGDVAVFAHAHLLRVLAARWLGLSPDMGKLLALHAASMSVVSLEHGQPFITVWNDIHHLEGIE